MKIRVRSLETLWHVFAFVLLTGAFVPLWRQVTMGEMDPGEGDPVQRVFLGIAYLGVGLLVFHPKRATATARRGMLIWMLLGWVLLSVLWSVAPAITLRRGLATSLAVLYGLLLAVRYPPRMVLRMLGVALAIVVVASLGAVFLFPEWAVSQRHLGAWQGVMANKNILGRTSVLALIVFWALYQSDSGGKRAAWSLLGLASFMALIGSRSITSLIAGVVVAIAWPFLKWMSRLPGLLKSAILSFSLAVALPVSLVLSSYLQDIAAFFGKNLTLTGRIPLWLSLIPYALEKPFLGYGYGAFWLGERGPSASISALYSWNPTHGHNGYLDLWLEVGLIGVALAVALFFSIFLYTARQTLLQRDSALFKLGFILSVYFVVVNTTYSLLLEARLDTGLYWILFVYIYLIVKSNNDSRPAIRTYNV